MKNQRKNIVLFGGIAALLAIALLLPAELKAAEKTPAEKGKELFDNKCTICHTIDGGKKVGPDLKGVTKKRPHDWLVKFISDPEKMFNENDPTATGLLKEFNDIRMPNQGLTKEQVTDVIAYLKAQEDPAKCEQEKKKTE